MMWLFREKLWKWATVGYVDQGPMNFITAHIYRQGGSGGESWNRKLRGLRDKSPELFVFSYVKSQLARTVVKSREASVDRRLTFRILHSGPSRLRPIYSV